MELVFLKLISSFVFILNVQSFLVPVDQSVSEEDCPNGWTYWVNHCYFFSPIRRNWNDSERACEQSGSHLVTIDTVDEDGFIGNFIKLSSKTHPSVYTWIGAYDFPKEGNWLWVTGKPLNASGYLNWRGNGPNNANLGPHGEDCLDWSYGGWNDNACSQSYNFICEKGR